MIYNLIIICLVICSPWLLSVDVPPNLNPADSEDHGANNIESINLPFKAFGAYRNRSATAWASGRTDSVGGKWSLNGGRAEIIVQPPARDLQAQLPMPFIPPSKICMSLVTRGSPPALPSSSLPSPLTSSPLLFIKDVDDILLPRGPFTCFTSIGSCSGFVS